MNETKEKYETPVITKVTFEDKELVAFHICKKQTLLEQDSGSCCNLLPFGGFNKDDLDPS